jgi:hypothetical protein
MTHRSRKTLVAFIAGGLLVLTAVTGTTLAHGFGPGRGGGGWIDPHPHGSAQPSHAVKASHEIGPWLNGHDPKQFECANGTVPAPTATPAATAASENQSDNKPGANLRSCSLAELKAAADKKIANLIASLQSVNGRVAKLTSVSDSDKAGLTSEITAAIADLTALKVKVDAETTVADVQADRKTIATESVFVRGIVLQVRLLGGVDEILAEDVKLDAQAVTLASAIAAAPSGIDTAAAQKYLDDMKADIAAARALAAPLTAKLLALTPADLKAGKSSPALAGVLSDWVHAKVDNIKARMDARIIDWILDGKPGFQGHHDQDKSPVPSLTPAPTATPV